MYESFVYKDKEQPVLWDYEDIVSTVNQKTEGIETKER